MRIKKGVTARARHKKILKMAEGYRGARRKLIKTAKEAVMHAGAYAFAGRKLRKRDMRTTWISRLNGALDGSNFSYSQFIGGLKKSKIEIDRKILADIAVSDPESFKQIVEHVQKVG
ncbi:MAG: 50S ribosomal protein L20 [Patescibacteria group bacterium]|nr:50S ribosomal protein L20 [Patescibacteria group bacterium]